jgi:hypothetical protein
MKRSSQAEELHFEWIKRSKKEAPESEQVLFCLGRGK